MAASAYLKSKRNYVVLGQWKLFFSLQMKEQILLIKVWSSKILLIKKEQSEKILPKSN